MEVDKSQRFLILDTKNNVWRLRDGLCSRGAARALPGLRRWQPLKPPSEHKSTSDTYKPPSFCVLVELEGLREGSLRSMKRVEETGCAKGPYYNKARAENSW